jgi:hypothetical protein
MRPKIVYKILIRKPFCFKILFFSYFVKSNILCANEELKIDKKWIFLLNILVETVFTLNLNSLTHIFIFLVKNKNIIKEYKRMKNEIINLNDFSFIIKFFILGRIFYF